MDLHGYTGVTWFVMLCLCCYFCTSRSCLDDERNTLQDIMYSLGFELESYGDDCCDWEWVDCSVTNYHVERITLHNFIEGQYLWYANMSLFSQLKELKELYLVGNGIGGLENQEDMCNLVKLQRLDLSYNMIDGELPSCLDNMSSLRILNLSKNQFSGNLSIFSKLSNIESIDVSYNFFQGLISLSTFANLSKLSYLDLSHNLHLEVESESPTWHPSFQLQDLLLAGCNLNHRSNRLLPLFLSTQYNLQTVDFSDNFLHGPFPAWMLHNVSSVLNLGGNSFAGQFPYAYQNIQLKLFKLDISSNLLEGPLPSNISMFLPNLTHFIASSNRFIGTIPPSLGELKNLELLDLSNNHFSGVIPDTLSKNSPLWYLNLSNNRLSGNLLPKDCNMQQLKWLLLHNNLFVGNMPTCLSNSSSLSMLDVGHNKLSGIVASQMPIFFELEAPLLGVNQFRGYIPMQLCQMKKLRFLDLSSNDFSGPIPSCLSDNSVWRKMVQENSRVPTEFTTKGNTYSFKGLPLTLMTGINLSGNQLTGTIPVQLGELLALCSLNLSCNLLTGDLPISFGNLTNLESLDLSHNRITGQIPPEIIRLTSLAIFSVAFNDLSGRIPSGPQLSTFSSSSYVGNPKLCGEPLSKCSDGASHGNQDAEQEEKIEEHLVIEEPLFFYSFVFVTYALGFYSVIALLCISQRLKRKYYAIP